MQTSNVVSKVWTSLTGMCMVFLYTCIIISVQ